MSEPEEPRPDNAPAPTRRRRGTGLESAPGVDSIMFHPLGRV